MTNGVGAQVEQTRPGPEANTAVVCIYTLESTAQ